MRIKKHSRGILIPSLKVTVDVIDIASVIFPLNAQPTFSRLLRDSSAISCR